MRTPLRPLLPLVASLCVLVSALVAPAVIGLSAASAANPSAAGWGNNAEGELGNGLGRYASAPGAVSQGARGASDPYTQISMGVGDFWSGGTNACGVTSAGSAYCWGSGTNGRLGSGSTANSVIPVAVARGARAADDTFVSVSVGKTSACGLTGRGAAFCWGMNASGQLGNGTLVDDSAPVAVTGGLTFKHVDVGGDAACGVATDDSVYCWGSNTSGQMALGSANATKYSSPTRISGGAIAAGTAMSTVTTLSTHVCALSVAGAAYCWGANTSGQLGNGTNSTGYVPVAVSGGLSFSALSAGDQYSCGATSGGAAYCWGTNSYGELGDGSVAARNAPTPVSTGGPLGGVTVSSVTAGVGTTCARTTTGALTCWGRNNNAQVGDGTTVDTSSPVTVLSGARPAGETWTQVTSGLEAVCAVTNTGGGYCWGSRNDGRLGNGTATLQTNPVWSSQGAIPASETLTAIDAGNGSACGLATGGGIYCWGTGNFGGLGNGSTQNQWAPVAVLQGAAPSGTTYDVVGAGSWHVCAVSLDDSAYCWGLNADGQLGNSSQVNTTTPVAVANGAKPAGDGWSVVGAGSDFSCGLTATHAMYCWGSNGSGQLGTNAGSGQFTTPQAVGGGPWKSLYVGIFHACAIAIDDSAYCWGSNWAGQIGNNTQTQANVPTLVNRSNLNAGEYFTRLGLGSGHTCGLTSAARILCWGGNNYGELGDGTNTLSKVPVPALDPVSGSVNYASVTANQDVSCAVTTANAAYCWGSNNMGQLGNGTQTNSNRPTAVIPVAGGPSEFSVLSAGNGWVVGLVVPPPVPGAATLTSATTTATTATISFTAGSSGGTPITNYEYALDGGAWIALSPAATTSPVTISGLQSGATYSVRLRAVNSYGGGAESNALSVTTASAPVPTPDPDIPPGVPVGVSGQPGDRAVTVTWSAPAVLGSPPAVRYQVESSEPGRTCSTAGLGCDVTGLVNGGAYAFRVRAVSLAMAGPWSPWTALVTPRTVPAPPASVVAVAGDGTATVGWSAPSHDGGSPITDYVVTASPGGARCASKTVSCEVLGLVNGTTYSFTVAARNDAGPSAASAPSNTVTPRAGATPSIVITGSRGTRADVEKVTISGITTGLDGREVQAMVRAQGRAEFVPRGEPITIDADEAFRWVRVIKRSARIYFMSGDVMSNRIFIPA